MPVFRTRKEPFEWLKTRRKSVDVRKGNPLQGQFAVYLSGRSILKMRIVKTEFGLLSDVIRPDNFKSVVPSASSLADAVAYLCGIYGSCDGVFTAYYVAPLE